MINIDDIISICYKYDYCYRIEGSSPELILIGEETEESSLDGQEEIIKKVEPKIILHEAADHTIPNQAIDSRRVYSWEKKYNIPVKLCNIPYRNRKNLKMSRESIEEIFYDILNNFGLNGDGRSLKLFHDIVNPLKEVYMADIINREIESNNAPLIAIVGSVNVRPHSYIHKPLHEKGISYITITQQKEMVDFLTENAYFFTRPQNKEGKDKPEIEWPIIKRVSSDIY